MVEPLNAYQRHLRQVIIEESSKAARGNWCAPLDDETVGSNAHYVAAVEALASHEDPEGAAKALSGVADKIHRWAGANRQSPGWADAALAMNWIRTAAARCWDVRPEAGPRP